MSSSRKDKVAGKINEYKGQIKEAFGKVVGNKKTETSGKLLQVKGIVQGTVGAAKDAVDNKILKAADKVKSFAKEVEDKIV